MTLQIPRLAWGEIDVRIGEETLTFRDCKIWPGGAVEWRWTDTGTHHAPGIQPADIEEVLAHGVEVVVLSRGQLLRLKVCPETEEMLKARRVEYHIKETRRAVKLFNELAEQGRKVGGLFHSTC